MQVASISGLKCGSYTATTSALAAEVRTAPPGPDTAEASTVPRNAPGSIAALAELPVQPALSALATDGGAETATLRDSTGAGGVPAGMAAAIYSLNLSLDLQARALDLLA